MAFELKDQTVELNRMRKRLASMTERVRTEYETRIANLLDTGTELEVMSAVTKELTLQWCFRSFRIVGN